MDQWERVEKSEQEGGAAGPEAGVQRCAWFQRLTDYTRPFKNPKSTEFFLSERWEEVWGKESVRVEFIFIDALQSARPYTNYFTLDFKPSKFAF